MYYGNNSNSDDQKVVEWINNATLTSNSKEKVQFLMKVQETVLNKSPGLMMKFLPDLLELTADRDAEVKKWLIGFIEEACKKNHAVIEQVMNNLHMLLCDESVQVQKRVIQAASSIYRNMLIWLAKAPQITERMEQAWNQFSTIKMEVLNMIDSDNDGIRTHSVKFLEGVVLIQSYPEQNTPRKENDFSLEEVPLTLKFARRRKLEEEANHIFTLLIKFHGSPHISSVNLMACMGALCTIAKSRPEFMPRVVNALESLLRNLPPTLTSSQVNSVKKHLKLQLTNILRHPSSVELQNQLVNLLTELGSTVQELARAIPKFDEQQRKRLSKRLLESQQPAKRPRLEPSLPLPPDHSSEMLEYLEQRENALKLNEQFIYDNLSNDTITHIVMKAMQQLPEVMPAHFQANYTPMTNPGAAKRKLSKLLATQFLEAGVGPGGKIELKEPDPAIITKEIKKEVIDDVENKKKEEPKRPRIKTLRLEQITKPLTIDNRDVMLGSAVKRILNSEQAAVRSGVSILRSKIITTLASTFGSSVKETVLSFILEDLRSQIDIALAWLYEEYSYLQGFNRSCLRKDDKPDRSYNSLLCAIITNLEGETKERDSLLSRVLFEAPLITEEAVDIVKRICIQEKRAPSTMNLLADLVFRRPTKATTFVNVLLHHTSHDNHIIRQEAISRILKLYEQGLYRNLIDEQAIVYLDFLTQAQPPPILFGEDTGRKNTSENWNDQACKACLYLYLALLPSKEILIHELSRIYTQTTADIKRTILRLLDHPIRGMGMESPELLILVESCTKGSETLVTRVIHILTDRGPPSPVLVAKVRELYQTRVSDVRFLIPVLNGLQRNEVIAALPKLIKLNPVVVKEVFNRLLSGHVEGPITPAELLIALHQIDTTKADLKTVMKATSLCFSERTIYTQEVLAVVMQQLMDVTPLPTLLMRTVIQSLSLYPRLSGFVMNILQRLIIKQVWKQKVVWEGFIKCCQRTIPQSFQVLLQLPAPQLAEALTVCPDMQPPLLEHVNSLSETQRAHIPVAIMDILVGKVDQPEASISDGTEMKIKVEPSDNLVEPLPPGME